MNDTILHTVFEVAVSYQIRTGSRPRAILLGAAAYLALEHFTRTVTSRYAPEQSEPRPLSEIYGLDFFASRSGALDQMAVIPLGDPHTDATMTHPLGAQVSA